ncbi:TatD family hydrolase [Patescibacteria group bacterium]
MLIDTHCHLNFKTYNNKVSKIINQANKAGVKKIVIPGASLKSSQKAVLLAEKYENIYASSGIHPLHAEKELKKHGLDFLEKGLTTLIQNKKNVAIGECGLDYFYLKKNKANKKSQEKIFSLQIKLAFKYNLPLIIHNRHASTSILKLFTQHKKLLPNLTGVFHCFQGNSKLLNWALESNFYIGITGIVSFDKKMQAVVLKTPLNKLLCETDSPFLTPEPLRSEKIFPNTPKNVKIIANWIARLKGDSFLNVEKQTTKNAVYLFKLIKNEKESR